MASVDQVISGLKRLKQRLPSIVGTEAVEFAVDNIRKEKTASGKAMKPRSTQNRSDRRNNARRGLLIDTGRGIRSIQVSRAFSGLVSISMEDYMQAHNTGATINHPGGTPYFSPGGKAVFVSKRKAAQIRAERGVRLRTTKPHTIKLPARPFLKMEKPLVRRVTNQLIKELNSIFK